MPGAGDVRDGGVGDARTAPALVCATHERYTLAEGPTWDPIHEELLWVDVEAGLVLSGSFTADDRIEVRETVSLGETVGAVAVTPAGDWIIAGADRLFARSSADGTVRPGRRILPPGSGRRLNDAKPDPAGRLLVGTLSLANDDPASEELVLLGEDGALSRIDTDLTLSNGLAWSADGGTLHSVDTLRRVVFRRPWVPGVGAAAERTIHLAFDGGYPDGICMDADEHLWVAMWGLGEIRRYGPTGDLVATIPVPAPHTSSVTFAGPDLAILVITTSNRDLTGEERARHPGAGALFTIRPGVRGRLPALCLPGVAS
jgi:sugar lactone lactonase YvrE